MMGTAETDAAYFGIQSIPAAVVFAALYLLLFPWELLLEYISTSIISRVIRRRYLFHFALLAAIVMGSVGISDINSSNDPNTISNGKSLHLASTIIFLVLSVLVVYQALIVAKNELRYGAHKLGKGTFGRFQPWILLLISLLLLVREGFAMATVNDFQKATNERLWYPLIAMPEILAVALFSIPGLVPGRCELPTHPKTPQPTMKVSRFVEIFHEGKN
ncbi:hypothetical protein C0995_004770 [Termitomyces sp. Mi166|nr:hypothetical protein C0995_004770 [Termitomyces sp. Mi166\